MIDSAAFDKERRRHPRHAFRAALNYENSGMHPAQGIDLSDQGISMATREPLEAGQEVTLHFIQRNVHVPGVVSNQDPLGHGEYRVGVRFVTEQTELVQVLLAAHGTPSD